MIFSVPAMKNGTFISDGCENKNPANNGLMAAPVVRATPVIPAAADRSSALTTAMVYDCRVGTSIWLILKRTSRTRTAKERFGISGIRMSRTFEGRCVRTMVFISPMRDASREGSSAESQRKHWPKRKSHLEFLDLRRIADRTNKQ